MVVAGAPAKQGEDSERPSPGERHPSIDALIGLNDRAAGERYTARLHFERLSPPLVVHRAQLEDVSTFGCIPAVYEAAHPHLSPDQQVGVLRSLGRQLDISYRWARIARHINRNALTLAIEKTGAGDEFWNSAAERILYRLVGAVERLVTKHATENGRDLLARQIDALEPGHTLTLGFDANGLLWSRLSSVEDRAA